MLHQRARRLALLLALGAASMVLSSACGAAEEPTATPTKAPAATPTPTTAAPGAVPTATRPALVATPTPAPAATSTATPAGPAVKKGGTLRYIYGSTPLQLDVLQTTTSADTTTMAPLYDGFVIVEPDRTFSPAQAQSWEVGDGGKSITLHLVKGMKFQDGTPFNAAAVKNDFEYKLDTKNNFDQRVAMTTISSIQAVDESTVKITLSSVDVLIFPNLAARPGWVYSPTYRDATAKPDRKNKPTGAGNFKLVQVLPDSHITYEPWASGFSLGKYPYVDKLTYLTISDPAVQIASYRAGDADVFTAADSMLPALRQDKRTVLAGRWPTEWAFLNLNPRYKPLDDVRVRKAMMLAINRQDFVAALLSNNEGRPIYGPVGPAWPWAYDPAYKANDYDPAGAKKLLAEAGFPNGFTLGPVTWFGKESLLPRMNLLADMMKQVGIKLELLMLDSSQASREYGFDKKAAAYSTGWGTGAPDLDTPMRDWLYSTNPRFMYAGYLDAAVSKELDATLDRGKGTVDLTERKKAYLRVQDIVNEQVMIITLPYGKTYMATRDYVKNYNEFPSGGGSPWFRVWLDR